MSAVAGFNGSVKIGGSTGTTVALVDQWTAVVNDTLLDQSSLGDVWTSDVPGLQTMTAVINGKWDVASDDGQTSLHNALLNESVLTLDLLTTGSYGYELSARVSDFTTTDPVLGLVTFQCGARSQGTLAFMGGFGGSSWGSAPFGA